MHLEELVCNANEHCEYITNHETVGAQLKQALPLRDISKDGSVMGPRPQEVWILCAVFLTLCKVLLAALAFWYQRLLCLLCYSITDMCFWRHPSRRTAFMGELWGKLAIWKLEYV